MKLIDNTLQTLLFALATGCASAPQMPIETGITQTAHAYKPVQEEDRAFDRISIQYTTLGPMVTAKGSSSNAIPLKEFSQNNGTYILEGMGGRTTADILGRANTVSIESTIPGTQEMWVSAPRGDSYDWQGPATTEGASTTFTAVHGDDTVYLACARVPEVTGIHAAELNIPSDNVQTWLKEGYCKEFSATKDYSLELKTN